MVQSRATYHPSSRRVALGLCAASILTATATAIQTQSTTADWPSRPVRFIEVFPPGTPPDSVARVWCSAMTEITGQQFFVDNRPGAGGTVGTPFIARAAPDGYTIGKSGIGQLAIAPALFARLAYDPERDLTVISGLSREPLLLVVNNDLAHTVPELVERLKREPGRHLYGIGGGFGTSSHLAAELFKARAGVAMEAVPYTGPTMQLDLIAGRVTIACLPISSPGALGALREGKFRALAVTSAERSPDLPDVPAMAEFLSGFDITSWVVLVGPTGLPPALVERMHRLSQQALDHADVVQRFRDGGITPWRATPAELPAYAAEQAALLAPVVRASGARIE